MNRSKAMVDRDLCSGLGCRVCLYLCPKGCIELVRLPGGFGGQQIADVNTASCTGCSLCEKSCFKGAIRVQKEW